MRRSLVTTLTMVVLCCACLHARANLLKNGVFEAPSQYVPPAGELCPHWQITAWGEDSTPDLYCDDGSFGLPPGTNGNFPGVLAFDGHGWVAGGSSNPEIFSQHLVPSLLPNTEYVLNAHLIRGQGTGMDAPGGYTVYLDVSDEFDLLTAIPVATIGATDNPSNWELRSTTFVSPADADELEWIFFEPYKQKGPYGDSCAYPGLDGVSLDCSTVPEPSSLFMLSAMAICGLLASVGPNRRRS